MLLVSGTKIGQYEIISPLGAGSMGEVYRARDSRLDRDVAIKVLPQLVSAEPTRLLRFEIEARAAAALNHPNILSVFQMGTHEGVSYMVCELLEGKTLAETLRRGPLPLRQAIQCGIQIAHGLAAAHEKGIVHRDLKPDNLFLTKDGRVKILDFGLAKVAPPKETSASTAPTVTRMGIAMGTVGYISPEQVRGQLTDHRTDIFAFGAILYEMVMGKRSFQKATVADTIAAILNEEPPRLTQLSQEIPLAIERLVSRCLEKNPERRFQSASDLAFALEALSDPSISVASGLLTATKEEAARSRGWHAAVACAAVALVAVLAVAAYSLLRAAPAPRVANYSQLTHDGQPKSLIGTEGARLYLAMGAGSSASFSLHGIGEMSVSGGEPKKLDAMSSPDMIPVDLSPDGSALLFVDGQGAPANGPLHAFPVLGGSPHRVGDFVAETAAWSSDGKKLAFTNLSELFVAKADGSDPRKLLTVKGDIRHVTWTPDGRQLRFDSTETVGSVGQEQLLWEAAADGTGLHRLLEGWHDPPDECCGKWTADGKYFVFQSQGQIWALPRSGGLFQSTPRPVQLTSSPLTLSSPLPSKDGKKLFVIGRNYRGQLVRYDSKSQRFAPFLGGMSAEYLAFSKDGQWIAYVSFPDGTMWRSKLDGSDRLQLTFPPMSPVLPRWSPDGKQILFFEFAVGAKPARIYTISPEGGSPRQILLDDQSQQLDPNWSPDGTKIVFSGQSNDPSSAIHIFDLATHQLSTLPASTSFFSPRWSPDGRYVTAFSANSDSMLLYDFQTQKWVTLFRGSLSWLNWSHDGQYVYALDNRGKNAVVRIRIRDHKMEQVADLTGFFFTGSNTGALALTPDDQPLLLQDTGTQDVYSIDWQSQ